MGEEGTLQPAAAGTCAISPHTDMAKRLRRNSNSSGGEDVDDNATPGLRSSSVESSAHTPKYASLEPAEPTTSAMRCSLPPHKPLDFNTYAEYESHYQQAHSDRCTECKKNFPTSHLLELHLAENHDPIEASRREAGEKTYACFVEGCDKVCMEWTKRRSHLVDKHGFPKNYDFLVVDHGIDGRRSMLRPGIDAQGHRRSSRERGRAGSSATQTTESTSVVEPRGSPPEIKAKAGLKQTATASVVDAKTDTVSKEPNVDELTSSLSSLKMVPRSITFGKRKGRSGFAKS